MERNTIAEMKEILDALEQGKQIQWYDSDKDTWIDFDINHGNPNFNFIHRIKPEEPKKRYRPFKDAEEFIKAAGGLGAIWLKDDNTNSAFLIIGYTNDLLLINNSWLNFGFALKTYTFLDGTPCGVEEDA